MRLRAAVLAVLVAPAAVLAAASAPAQDLLVMRDASRRTGAVAGCREDVCTLDLQPVPRATIAWVGLRQDADARTPAPRDPLRDEVHLRDGRVVGGDFEGMSLGAVAIEDLSYDRDEVAWIRFRGAVPASAPPPPAPAPAPPSPSPSASPGVAGPCPPSAPLGGSIVQDIKSTTDCEVCTGRAELWFDLHPLHPYSPLIKVHPVYKAKQLAYRLRIDGCTATATCGSRCTAPEKETAAAIARLDDRGPTFYPLDPRLTFDTLPEEIELAVQLKCRYPNGSDAGTYGWSLQPGGSIEAAEQDEPDRHTVRPTPCARPATQEQDLDCTLRPERYAVIPFAGVDSRRWSQTSDAYVDETTRWNVCCGCGARAETAGPARR